ncbi:glucokinase [Paraferrimonas sedimenticola]|uniref:Glucokinase n=1 Tax=Paraferrimonas sedimenticola TaxID=375674 RepID=A0AA37VUS0_9GAMM|nr:glucokinase [Paraferrimonas sedimenticola]GLP95846.1 glucokinase [Paraferrimonas sedimenticola]
MSNTSQSIIVADIGGTNARFALARKTESGIDIDEVRFYPSADYPSLEAVVRHYKDSLPSDEVISGACLAVAGPSTNHSVSVTNLAWHANIEELRKQLELPALKVINDFVAYAYSIPLLPDSQLQTVKPGEAMTCSPRVVLGPGTGFGVASLVPMGNRWHAVPCEGGHISLAATNARQAALVEILARRYAHVSVETILCGRGLVNLYQAMATLLDAPTPLSTPAEITQAADSGKNPLARETLDEFCRWLGSVTADMVLVQGARGGAYLGGGILPRIAEFLQHSDFTRAFGQKGMMTEYLEPVPVSLALKSDTALMGAAAWYFDQI